MTDHEDRPVPGGYRGEIQSDGPDPATVEREPARFKTELMGTWCPQCGPDVYADEDGCCKYCGSEAIGDGAEQALALKARVAELEAVIQRFDAWANPPTGGMGGGLHAEMWPSLHPGARREMRQLVEQARRAKSGA